LSVIAIGARFGDPVDLREARDKARGRSILENPMRNEYDFSKSRKNPYAKQLKRQITIRLDTAAVNYFKEMAAELGMPYQNLINLFLRDCAIQKRRPVIQWPRAAPKR
jgi:predicted DNA binding CopG/RHH family protein